MNFGKALSFMSPAMGMATGQGFGKIMPFLSPGYGMMSGKGPFGGMLGADEDDPLKKLLAGLGGGMPTGMFGAGMPGMMGGMFGGGG